MRHRQSLIRSTAIAATVGMMLSGTALAQGSSGPESAPDTTAARTPDEESRDRIIVTGSRRAERTVLESNVPVDLVSEEALQSTFAVDLNNKLQSLIPSYSVRRIPPADGSIFVRPATLRNLSPDHTLVLVNGKRFHRSAFVDVTARGAQAVNLALIPAGAFKQVEVLRDGAAAQYGSDAIAGVINFILDDETGTDAYVQYGEYDVGDGQNLQVGLSTGFVFGEDGFFNIAAEYSDSKATSRGIQRPQAGLIAALGEPYASAVAAIGDLVQRYGQPDLESTKVFFNSGIGLGGSLEAYAFGNYAESTGVNDFNYRGSLTVTGPGASGATTTFARNGGYARSRYQSDGTNGVESWTAIFPDWNLLSLYPGGFTPRFGSDSTDYSLVAGLRGEFASNFDWDISASVGSNKIDYWLKESINLSLGPLSPTDFYNGSREQLEHNLSADFVYSVNAGLATPVNIGFGLEYRREEFSVSPGEEASWILGPLRDLSPGSNGFPGAHPLTSGTWSSDNKAAYVDVDLDVTDRLNLNFAGRYEDFSLFGQTFNGKIAGRYEVSDALSFRGAVSSGFRAPTPGQQNLYNVSQNPNVDPLIPRSVDTRGQLPSNSLAASFFGGEALKPEESINLSVGLVFTPTDNLSVTVDAYQIDITDRIGLSQSFDVTDALRAQLVAAQLPFAGELTNVSFYTNAFDTQTSGIDVVVAWQQEIGPGNLSLTWASNYNDTEFTYFDPLLFPEPARVGFLKSIPNFTSHLSADYSLGDLTFTARARHFGEWVYVANTTVTNPIYEDVSAETFFDLIGSWQVTDNLQWTVGVENVLDEYSDEVELITLRNNGRRYVGGTPYENDGRLFYARVGVSF